MKRFILTSVALSILLASLVVFPGGKAFAAERTALVLQHAAIPADTQNFSFRAWWGWGVCLNEATTQRYLSDANRGDEQLIASSLVGLVNAPSGVVLGILFAADNIWLRGLDHGKGICVGVGLANVPVAWSRS